MQLAFSSNAYTKFSIEETIRRIAALGYAGLELLADVPHAWPAFLLDEQKQAIRDALSRNLPLTRGERSAFNGDAVAPRVKGLPAELKTILANCLTHGRRRFVEVAMNFPQECLYVLKVLKDVYENDSEAKRQGMSPEQRLQFHQAESGPKMAELDTWLTQQIGQHKVEPNSGLGEAITYMLKHWKALTLFLRHPGAPLDNNICEQALKKVILHRKNAYFYKTENGARVGDLFMSLIHTCELNKANPFEYLTELQKHASELFSEPNSWMPWNYRDMLQRTDAP